MRPYADVDLTSKACKYSESAELFGRGVDGIMDATGWDLPVIMKRISEVSGVTLNSVRQMRAGDRDPRRSAAAVSDAIVKLGGPRIVFPSQSPDGKGSVAPIPAKEREAAAAAPLPAGIAEGCDAQIAIRLTLAEAKRRLATTFGVPVSAITFIDHS